MFAIFIGQGVNHLSYGYGMIIRTPERERTKVVDVKFRYTSLRLPVTELLRATMPEAEHEENMRKYYSKPEVSDETANTSTES